MRFRFGSFESRRDFPWLDYVIMAVLAALVLGAVVPMVFKVYAKALFKLDAFRRGEIFAAAVSFDNDIPWRNLGFTAVGCVILAVILFFSWRAEDKSRRG